MWEIIKQAFCMVCILIVAVSSFIGIGYIAAQITGLPIFLTSIVFNAIFYIIIYIVIILEIISSNKE